MVGMAFQPAAPIDHLDLFAGRETKIQDVISAVTQTGMHVGLYGERGVGKTSLARVLEAIFKNPNLPSYEGIYVNCQTDDTYESLWRNIFRYVRTGQDPTEFTPEGIRYDLETLPEPAIIVIDELDRLEDDEALSQLADTIKTLSDHSVRSTLILVGVANSIGSLIGEHESISRNLTQIKMPRMSNGELMSIIQKGGAKAAIEFDDAASSRIVALSEGLPHYTHLLAQKAAIEAIQNDQVRVEISNVDSALESAVSGHTMEDRYLKAIYSPQPGNLYREVLLACALAKKDNLGYFSSKQVRGPLSRIAGRELDIPAFSSHLSKFADIERGVILRREGQRKSYRYQFTDPMIQPYVIITALHEGLITNALLDEIRGGPPSIDEDVIFGDGKLF